MADPVTGTVTRMDLEGGFYGIVTDDGENLLPLDLPAAYQRDGVRIRFASEKVSVFTLQQWGTPVRISSIREIS